MEFSDNEIPIIPAHVNPAQYLVQSNIEETHLNDYYSLCELNTLHDCSPHSLFFLGLITYKTASSLSREYCSRNRKGINQTYIIDYLTNYFGRQIIGNRRFLVNVSATESELINDMILFITTYLLPEHGTPIVLHFNRNNKQYSHAIVLYRTKNNSIIFIDPQNCDNRYEYNLTSNPLNDVTNPIDNVRNLINTHDIFAIDFYTKETTTYELNTNIPFMIKDVAYGGRKKRKSKKRKSRKCKSRKCKNLRRLNSFTNF